MDNFKIMLFGKTYKEEKVFPGFSSLTKEEVHEEYMKFNAESGYDKLHEGLLTYFEKHGLFLKGQNALDSHFDVKDFLKLLGLPIAKYVYLVWGDFESIDKMIFTDFVQFFSDIWYPSYENLTFYFDNSKYMVFVHHGGILYLYIAEKHLGDF